MDICLECYVPFSSPQGSPRAECSKCERLICLKCAWNQEYQCSACYDEFVEWDIKKHGYRYRRVLDANGMPKYRRKGRLVAPYTLAPPKNANEVLKDSQEERPSEKGKGKKEKPSEKARDIPSGNAFDVLKDGMRETGGGKVKKSKRR